MKDTLHINSKYKAPDDDKAGGGDDDDGGKVGGE
jgi:hypothetical protein